VPERGRRGFLRTVPGALLALELPLAHGATIVAVRVWPARDYTRVTLELDAPLRTRHFTVADPDRLVVDLEGIALDGGLRDLVAKVQPNDPYITAVRIGQNRPRVVRMVFDLKAEIAPQVFSLTPIDAYRHRLVLDLHPVRPRDPLADLVDLVRQNAPPVASPGLQAAETPAQARASDTTADPIAALIRERETRLVARERKAQPAVRRMVTVAIDPGHGGEDPGAIGQFGTREKDVVLAVALKLRDRVNAEPDMRAFLTRDSDFFVPLASRVRKARSVSADLFVSIHADAFVQPQARGSSVFVLADRSASSVGARWLAQRENRSDLVGGVNLARRNRESARVLLEMSTAAQIQESRRLGAAVLGELRTVGNLHKPTVEQAAFAVLRAPDMPSILVETAFISNPEEELRLRDPRYQARLADAMFAGIRRYFRRHPPGRRGQAT